MFPYIVCYLLRKDILSEFIGSWSWPMSVGRFRILGRKGLEYWGGGQVGGGEFPAGTRRRNDVDAT